ncbi:class I adenylate-forming enzyme family protein [Hyphomicrobium sp.]|uniref:class I adenylate-forming enzyme family protein n=1 Tax=Hyphomicrobium sp. TaxID=82 RepID=UPI0025B95D0D|nr:class I adenylate-forming enzyme family protein [Hyphomicrobium sp.]MCC7251674.1 acyl--CoA ligase [Hyphomicrobium sp.]
MDLPLYTPANNPPFNMARYCLAGAAAAAPDKPALIVIGDPDAAPSEIWTYADLEDAVLRTAGALRELGLAPGDRVMIRLDNTSAYAILFFGAVAAGLVALPASSQLTDREALFLLTDSSTATLACTSPLSTGTTESPPPLRVRAREGGNPEHRPSGNAPLALSPDDVARMMREGPRIDYTPTRAEDPAFLIYTSGTTAYPKGVLHAHRSALGRRPMYQGWYGISAADRVLHAGAFNWTFTLGVGLTDPWANGATAIVYTGEKDPALWPTLIERTEATLFAGVPGIFRQILKYTDLRPATMPTLRHALMAGEAPPPDLFEEWTTCTGRDLYEALGMSEISTYISTGPGVPRKPGTVGKAQPGRRVAILPVDGADEPLPPNSDGLIAVHRSDPGLMLSYWNRPAEQAEVLRGDWFAGGDLGRMDADGYIAHLGRNNEIIKALGYRVSPMEVEAVLATHPDIAEVACAEVVGAFVVLKPGSPTDSANILAFAAERLAAYKCPREIRFVDTLPRTANGKIKRSALVSF